VLGRAFLTFLALPAAALLSGCSGADAQRAQTLLLQANQALSTVNSASFNARLTTSGDVPGAEAISVVVSGGGYFRGPRAGDLTLTMSAEGVPSLATTGIDLVKRGDQLYLNQGGFWRELPIPASASTAADDTDVLAGFDLARYVKDVSVTAGPIFDGQPTERISGVIDTAGLVEGSLKGLGSAGQFAQLPDLSEFVGDTKVVLYLATTTHLPLRALIDLKVKADGKSAKFHLGLALLKVNRPVAIPVPS
jgi:hypothetical protein